MALTGWAPELTAGVPVATCGPLAQLIAPASAGTEEDRLTVRRMGATYACVLLFQGCCMAGCPSAGEAAEHVVAGLLLTSRTDFLATLSALLRWACSRLEEALAAAAAILFLDFARDSARRTLLRSLAEEEIMLLLGSSVG